MADGGTTSAAEGSGHALQRVIARVRGALAPVALVLGVVCLVTATAALVLGEGAAPGPVAALLAAPVFLIAARLARAGRLHAAGDLLAAGLLGVALAVACAGGAHSPVWSLLPLLVLLVGLALGLAAGWLAASGAVVALVLVSALPAGDGAWGSTSLAVAATLGGGLLGVWLHRLLADALRAERERIEHLRETERALVERERLLRHAMRVETVGDLASMVAHQLRNHLQVMTGHAQLGSAEGAQEKDARFATIRGEIDTSIALLEQLLELVHPEEGAECEVDLVPLCRQLGDSVRRILPAAIALDTDLPDRPVRVVLNPSGLEHALLNLVINARHAIPDKGRLTLSVRADGGAARVQVSDTGVGIPAPDLARVFEPYFTTKPKGEGTGLGLAAVERYVRASSGVVSVESEPGRGTTFTLEFPLAS